MPPQIGEIGMWVGVTYSDGKKSSEFSAFPISKQQNSAGMKLPNI